MSGMDRLDVPARENDHGFYRKGLAGALRKKCSHPGRNGLDLLHGISAGWLPINCQLHPVIPNRRFSAIGLAVGFRLDDVDPLWRDHNMVDVKPIRGNVVEYRGTLCP